MTTPPFFDQSTAPKQGAERLRGARLHGTVALVTAASSGIGAATATALTAQGAAVALESDISDERQATEVVTPTVAELGRLDMLINNAEERDR